MSTKKEINIILLSALDIWSMGENKGAQSLYRTLLGLADLGKVYFITGNVRTYEDKIHDNITTARFGLPWLQKTFFPTSRFYCLRFVFFPIWWLIFQIISFFIVLKIIKKSKSTIDLLYAYETAAIPVMKLISLISKKKLVIRFMGTVMYPQLKKPLSHLTHFHYYLALKTKADILIMADDGTQGDKVLEYLKNKSSEIYFWRNGVDLPKPPDSFRREEVINTLGIPPDSKILLTISRLVFWKRVDRAINALSRLDNPRVHLVIIGDGDTKNSLLELSKKLKIQKNTHFLGAVKRGNLGQYYAIADIFLSLYDLSNVGNPLLEAMSFGKPIITLNNGDTGKCIRHMKTGVLIEPDNEVEIEKYITILLSDDNLRIKLSNEAKKFAQANFWTWDQRINEEKKVLYRLIHNQL